MRKTSQKFLQSNLLCRVALVAILLAFQAMLGIGAGVLYAQKVTGTVISGSDNEPLIGASVMVQGTKVGSVTDLDGNFTIDAKNGQTLEVSYLGFITQKVKVNGQKLNITLQEDKHSLDEVVVVGYGVQKKKLVTGATAQVKGDDIAKLNTTNPLQAMQGQTPGVSISSTSGQPGSGMKVQIRGLGTVGDASPLYLIDGIGGDISTLNPADIESIDVLKDAASAAIYGAQAANGVVLITTKSGKAGRAEISFDAYKGWQTVARKAKLLNSKEYMTIMDEERINSGGQPYDWSSFKSIYDTDGNLIDTDWVSSMLKDNAQVESYSLGITGGGKTSTYAMSLGYMDQEGVVGGKKVSNYERYNFRINSEHKVIDNILKVGEQVSFIYKKSNGVMVGNSYNNTLRGAFGTSPLSPIYASNPYAGAYAEDLVGQYNGFYGSPYNATDGSDWYKYDGNPYGAMMTNTNNQTKNVTFSGNAYAELTPFKGFKFRTVFGAVYGTSEYRGYTPLYHFSPYSYQDTRTSASQNMNHGLTLTWTNTAQYDWSLGKHEFSALLGTETSRYEGTYLGASSGNL